MGSGVMGCRLVSSKVTGFTREAIAEAIYLVDIEIVLEISPVS